MRYTMAKKFIFAALFVAAGMVGSPRLHSFDKEFKEKRWRNRDMAILYKGLMVEHEVILGYTFSLYNPVMYGCPKIIIEKFGEILYIETLSDGDCFYFLQYKQDKFKRKPGTDIDGDGVPDVVVGTGCGMGYYGRGFYIFSLKYPLQVRKLDAIYNECCGFKDLDADGVYEFITKDCNYDCFGGCGRAESPRPEIVLKYTDGKYRLAPEFMMRGAPSAEEEEKLIKELRSRPCWHDNREPKDEMEKMGEKIQRTLADMAGTKYYKHVPCEVAMHAIELIYKDHPKLALEFIDRVWPEDIPGKDEYITSIKKALERSEYWPELKRYLKKRGVFWE